MKYNKNNRRRKATDSEDLLTRLQRERVLPFSFNITEEKIKEYYNTPFDTGAGRVQIGKDLRMRFLDMPYMDPMNYWDFRRPNWVERRSIKNAIDFRYITDPRFGVICRTDDEIRFYKQIVRQFYDVTDVQDESILNVPVRTVIGRFIDVDEENKFVLVDIADKDCAVVIPCDPDYAVDFVDIVTDKIRDTILAFRIPYRVEVSTSVLNRACEVVGVEVPGDEDLFRFDLRKDRSIRSEVRKMMKHEDEENDEDK